MSVIAEPRCATRTVEASAARSAIRGRILIVDDEPHFAAAMVRMLAAEHDAVAVGSVAGAKEALAGEQSFDGIVCDLLLPGMTGMDLHAWLAERDPALAERMIFVTGGAFSAKTRAFLEQVNNPWL